MRTAGVTLYFDGISVLAIDLVGTLTYKPTPHFYGAVADFLEKHASHVTPDRFRKTFRRRFWEHSIDNYETDLEFFSAVLADLFLTYGPTVEALTDTLTDIYLDSSPAFTNASPFLQAMCRSFKLVASSYVGPWARRILESIRDGRDVSRSMSEWPKVQQKPEDFIAWNQDPVSIAAWWSEFNLRLGRKAGRLLPSGRCHELRYEALTIHPRRECEKRCAFLGLAFDDAILHFHVDRGKPDPGLELKRAGQPVIPGLRDWQSQMSAEELERFEATAGELLVPDLRYWTMRRVFVARWPRTFVRATNAWGRE